MKKQWISVKCGLSRDPKHRQAMGESIWLFLHILDIASWDDGIAHDWKDEAAAEDMGMPVRTLREHRRKLDELGYISCLQKQYTQDIVIKNWTNPREYNGQVYNEKQGSSETSPEGYTQGYTQGNRKDVTPTLDSNNQRINSATQEKQKKQPKEKTAVHPNIKLFREVVSRYPAKVNYDDVIASVARLSERLGREVVKDDLLPFYKRWCGLGYNPFSLSWMEWAEAGSYADKGYKPKGDIGRSTSETLVREL